MHHSCPASSLPAGTRNPVLNRLCRGQGDPARQAPGRAAAGVYTRKALEAICHRCPRGRRETCEALPSTTGWHRARTVGRGGAGLGRAWVPLPKMACTASEVPNSDEFQINSMLTSLCLIVPCGFFFSFKQAHLLFALKSQGNAFIVTCLPCVWIKGCIAAGSERSALPQPTRKSCRTCLIHTTNI